MIGLETDRLRFRMWEEDDFPSIAKFFSDINNAQYVGGTMNAESAWRLMANYIGHYHLKGYSYLALEDKLSKQLLGTVGLWNSEPWPEPELGYWLLPEAQGQGFASEAGQCLKAFAANSLKLPSLVSYIDTANHPSKALAKRLGGKLDTIINLLDFGPHEVYRYW